MFKEYKYIKLERQSIIVAGHRVTQSGFKPVSKQILCISFELQSTSMRLWGIVLQALYNANTC